MAVLIIINADVSRPESEINAIDLTMGEVVKADIGKYGAHTLLRTFDGVVSLTDPRKTWPFGTNRDASPTLENVLRTTSAALHIKVT